MIEIPLIPRKILFGNPDHVSLQISPDGEQLAWLAPSNGVLNVWVAPRDNLDAAGAVTNDTVRGIRFFQWAYTNAHILYLQDREGDEDWHLYSVDLAAQSVLDLTPYEGIHAQPEQANEKRPEEIVVGLNDRNPQWHDLYRINIVTGVRDLILENNRFAGVVVDQNYDPHVGIEGTEDGGFEIYLRQSGDWKLWRTVPQEDALTENTAGIDSSNNRLYLYSSMGRNTAALFEIDLDSQEERLLAENERADAGSLLSHPITKVPQAVSFTYQRKRWQVLDPDIQPDIDALSLVAEGELEIVSRSLDDRYWVAYFLIDDGPGRYYLYERKMRTSRFLFSDRPAMEGLPLVKMHSAVIKSNDGLDLILYYSLPAGSDSSGDGLPDQPVPMVLFPHGGPWSRDTWGFNRTHQWLANRGYAVLSVNFRSSTGLGKAFQNAGDHEWGEKIMEDQQDAVKWAIDQGIAMADQVAVMGGSFGGYSVLAGLTFFPDTFACGVDIVGPSNLVTLLKSVPEYWKPVLNTMTARIGDFRTEVGRALLNKHSPLNYVDRIKRPLLIAQGVNDPRVKQAESDQIVEAMQAKDIPVTYVLYPDEGHGFARPENNISFSAVAEAFLAGVLEGRFEAIGDDFQGASLQVKTGGNRVPGLEEALYTPPSSKK